EALINQTRAKLLSSTRLDDLKKSLASFNEKAFKIKEFQANPYKITSVASSSRVNLKASPAKSNLKASPVKHAYEKFSYLAEPESTTLTLPIKYRVLCEMFRSMDTVASILYNRKEEITFEKVREGVQKMMKRNFGKNHLGQIVTIYPSAYTLTLKKCLKKTSTGEYKLVISPMISENEDRKDSAFVPMHGQCLINRRKEFNNSILKLVKKYHQEFLTKINFGTVLEDQLKHWHPKFALDSVPDVQIAKIPEPPESKISTAKDVLKIIKGSTIKSSKIEDALQKVANKSAGDDNITANIAKTDTKKSALKGICSDLLEKIRARESARCLEIMSRSPDETKKKAMLERLPRIIDILWHYFTSERKGAISIDTVVEKIIYSLNSLTMADEVKEHLKLITETFPGWLTFIEIPKGVYLRIDKKRNITEMLANFEH
ncbi:DNA replication factor Cdt1, partial [Caerostris extrusa]